MLKLSWFNWIVQETIVGTSGFFCLCYVQDEGLMIQDEFVSRWSLLELFQIHSRIKADLPDPLHLGSGEAENLPTPGLGAGRGGASPDPWILGSGESEHLPTPGLGVGRIGDRPSRGQAHPTPGLRSDEAESQAHPTPGRRGLKVGRRGVPSYHGTESPYRSIPPVWGVGTI